MQRLHQRMFGKACLNNRLPGTITAARTTTDLQQGLCQALAGPVRSAEQRLIGIEHHAQGDRRIIMPLGDHLRTDQNAGLAGLQLLQPRFKCFARSNDIAVDAQHGCIRIALIQTLFQLLGTDTVMFDFVMPAFRAALGQTLVIATMMTEQRMLRLMQGESRVTVAALRLPAAFMTHNDRREATTVQVHQHLTGILQMGVDTLKGLRRTAKIEATVAYVDQVYWWRIEARWTMIHAVTEKGIALTVRNALQRRRCRAEQDRNIQHLRAFDGDIASVITNPVFLSIGMVMFLVDNNHTEVFALREQAGARTQHDARFGAAETIPGLVALVFGEARV